MKNNGCIIVLLVCFLMSILDLVLMESAYDLRTNEQRIQIAIPEGPENGIMWRFIGNMDLNTASIICKDYSDSAFLYYTINSNSVEPIVDITCDQDDNSIQDCEFTRREGMATGTVFNIFCLTRSNYPVNSIRVLEDNRLIRLQQRGSSSYAWGQVCINNPNTNTIACETIRNQRIITEEFGYPNSGEYRALELFNHSCNTATLLSDCSFTSRVGSGDCESEDVIPNCTTLPPSAPPTTNNPTTIGSTVSSPINNVTQTSKAGTQNITGTPLIIPNNRTATTTNSSSSNTPSSLLPASPISNILPVLIGTVSGCVLLTLLVILLLCGLIVILKASKARKSKSNVQYHKEEIQERIYIDYENLDQESMGEFLPPGEQNIDGVTGKRVENSREGYEIMAPMVILEELGGTNFNKTLNLPKEKIYDQVVHQSGMIVPSLQDREYLNLSTNDPINKNKNHHSNSRHPCFIYQNDTFWEPEDTETGIYTQMSLKRYREINPEEIIIDKIIGSGKFGCVHNGVWRTQKVEVPVAIKTIKGDAIDSNVGLLQEAAILGQFNHPNILKLLGVVTMVKPMMMATELMRTGLTDFLDMIDNSNSIPLDTMEELFLRFTSEIANGMEHLASKKYVHRDLAARNILISHSISCKIGDFGLARGVGVEEIYYVSKGGLVPLKWTAPEAILYMKYSEKSDVFSYGVTLFEIWSIGKRPWKGVPNRNVAQKVLRGEMMPPPANCPINIYKLMVQCWHPTKDERPAFNKIVSLLQNNTDILKRDAAASSTDRKRKAVKDLQEMYLKSDTVYFDV